MHKLDPSMKRWTRRWFVLKGRELKYFSSVSIYNCTVFLHLCIILYYTVLYIILYYTVLYCIILYYTVLYIILYYTVLYCIILIITINVMFFKAKSRKAKGVINLETWCKISRHEMTSSFQVHLLLLPW